MNFIIDNYSLNQYFRSYWENSSKNIKSVVYLSSENKGTDQ